jgi:hypothetical protein
MSRTARCLNWWLPAMKLDYVPLLQIQRDLQDIPRGLGRFRQYLRTISPDGAHLELPSLLAANPMAKDHVTALLDALLALDADGIAARTVAEASAQLADEPGDFKVAVVILDDLMGGWTNRYAEEFTWRFQVGPARPDKVCLPHWTKYYWVNGILWSSEPATERAVREAVLAAIYRAAYVQRHGPARTLCAMLTQEGCVMARAGCTGPVLDEEEIAYTREVLTPFLDAGDKRTAIECLFGDMAGRTLGFTPRGLSPFAGLALALYDARSNETLKPTGPA